MFSNKILAGILVLQGIFSTASLAQSKTPAGEYQIYRGNTHAHTAYTWSHGEQFAKSPCKGIVVFGGELRPDSAETWKAGYVTGEGCPAIIIMHSTQYPGPDETLKPEWQKFQGRPAMHFAAAKAQKYDFYITTDHSQDYAFNPPAADNLAWNDSQKAASEATDSGFVAIRGYEHSENNGPNGEGHLNIINSATYLNALDRGVDIPKLYNWLKTAKPAIDGPVIGCFNHPGAEQYNNWAYRDSAITDIMTLLEVINSNNKIHEEGFIHALDKGWKVSPVCGNDNHGLSGISKQRSRTFVLATTRTPAALLDAMKNRRTYASLDQNIQCRYTVNDQVMGSNLSPAKSYRFNINISDPDTNDPASKITKIEILGDGGTVLKTHPANGYAVQWSTTLPLTAAKYFFIRVYNAGGGDAAGGDPQKPVAWLAPVWTGR